MDLLHICLDAISDILNIGLAPIPALVNLGLPYSIFDLAGSLRLALVLRQLRDAERIKAQELQKKLEDEQKPVLRDIEEPYLVKDLITIFIVIYGGELVCSPWLQFTPSFLTMPAFPLLFMGAQVFINTLPYIPPMSIHTELPLSLFDAVTRAFLLTTGTPSFILNHVSPTISSSPWALTLSSLILANAGFFFVNLFQMLSPYGWHVKTPPEFLPGGWRTMDLWVAPLMTGLYALLTQAQTVWVPYHTYAVQRVGKSTIFGSIELLESTELSDNSTITRVTPSVQPMQRTDARSLCALVLAMLFAYRAILNFGIDWGKSNGQTKSKKRVIRSKNDGKRLSKDHIKISYKS
ncbi:hypothetical protein FRC14_002822 [Serendipita sp. 396]|nr:hypothetical protein FRC14_002822 [Serendipita sp. 396]KAG8784954.1 hypothetical protein FRC15_002291 [Serendipita sp. 397]KAG8859929.1 hypothetical protein FRB91_005799 [Serendipita sp. 411]KAG8868585.1 hypothetical protein FRC20_003103 [Serendipita sp. 405]